MEKIKLKNPITNEVIIALKNNTARCKTFQFYDTVETTEGGLKTIPMDKGEIVSLMKAVINKKNKYKNSWFWSNNGNQRMRTKREEWACGIFAFAWNGSVYCYELDFSMSRNNVYMRTNKLTKDGKGNLRDWKKLMKELCQTEDDMIV